MSAQARHAQSPRLALAGYRVVEFSHMVMGPSCGMVLADLGAEVIKVEPVGGDQTRRLKGSGAGFFAMFNRNKQSVALDLGDARGVEVVLRLIATADVVSENFRAGAMDRLGLGREVLERVNPRLVFASMKGFLPGPYEQRTALDEVVQMMGGLAYMTGPPGRPLRAGTSVNDIMGGMFAAIGVIAALLQRDHATRGTGHGMAVSSALFENNVLLMGQHMLQHAITGSPAPPMPERVSAWGVYDVFTVAGGEQIFLGVVSDGQWAAFCGAFGFADLHADPRLATNNDRVDARGWLIEALRARLAGYRVAEVARRFEAAGLPFAPITRPQDLVNDPHLEASAGLARIVLPQGPEDAPIAPGAASTDRDDDAVAARPARMAATPHARVPLLPITLDGRRPAVRTDPPRCGAHTRAVLAGLGYTDAQIDALYACGVAA